MDSWEIDEEFDLAVLEHVFCDVLKHAHLAPLDLKTQIVKVIREGSILYKPNQSWTSNKCLVREKFAGKCLKYLFEVCEHSGTILKQPDHFGFTRYFM